MFFQLSVFLSISQNMHKYLAHFFPSILDFVLSFQLAVFSFNQPKHTPKQKQKLKTLTHSFLQFQTSFCLSSLLSFLHSAKTNTPKTTTTTTTTTTKTTLTRSFLQFQTSFCLSSVLPFLQFAKTYKNTPHCRKTRYSRLSSFLQFFTSFCLSIFVPAKTCKNLTHFRRRKKHVSNMSVPFISFKLSVFLSISQNTHTQKKLPHSFLQFQTSFCRSVLLSFPPVSKNIQQQQHSTDNDTIRQSQTIINKLLFVCLFLSLFFSFFRFLLLLLSLPFFLLCNVSLLPLSSRLRSALIFFLLVDQAQNINQINKFRLRLFPLCHPFHDLCVCVCVSVCACVVLLFGVKREQMRRLLRLNSSSASRAMHWKPQVSGINGAMHELSR